MEREAQQQSTDAHLVEQAIGGDRAAFDALMRKHMGACYRIARRFGVPPEDAADIVQDAFLAAYRALHRFNFAYSFSTWITRILVNRLSNFRRNLKRARNVFWRQPDEAHGESVIEKTTEIDPHMETEQSELASAIEKALQKLSLNQRTAFILFEIEGFKIREIAAILDIPEGTVTSRLHHARLEMRRLLDRTLR